MVLPPDSPKPTIHVLVFGPDDQLDEHEVERVEELRDLAAVSGTTAWIDVEGFGDQGVLAEIGEVLGIHPLAMADVVHRPQRPKAALYSRYIASSGASATPSRP
jgi:magnesium transporter